MSRTAVRPMATPARSRRTPGLAMLIRTGDAGCSSTEAKVQAEIMNVPRQMPSIMYSGQCCVNARFALLDQCPVLALAAAGSDSSCAANISTASAGAHWISCTMRGGIPRIVKGYEFRKFLCPIQAGPPLVSDKYGCESRQNRVFCFRGDETLS